MFGRISLGVGILAIAVQGLLAQDTPPNEISLDVNARDAPENTMSGFQSFVISGTGPQNSPVTRSFAGVEFTLSSANAEYGDRIRENPQNQGDFTQAELLQDFVFAETDIDPEAGLNLDIEGLEPSTSYTIRIWGFDSASSGRRVSDWFANGALIKDNHSFADEQKPPVSNETFQFVAVAETDEEGSLLLEGRDDPSSTGLGVFLNAIQLTKEGEVPSTEIVAQPEDKAAFPGGSVTFNVDVFGAGPFSFQWLKDGEEIEGATGSTLTVSGVTPEDAGEYQVEATGGAGDSVTSKEVVLTVETLNESDAGLMAYWPLDTVDEGATPEEMNEFDMTLNNMSSENVVEGRRDQAFQLDGEEEFLSFQPEISGGLPIYTHANGVYSVTMWVKGESGQEDRRIFSEGSTESDSPLLNIGTDNTGETGKLDLFLRNSQRGSSRAPTPLSHKKSESTAFDGTWHHIAWVDSGGAARLYIDGELDDTDFGYTRGFLDLNTTSIGAILRSEAGAFFAGSIDDVALWNKALTSDQAKALAEGASPTEIEPSAPEIIKAPAQELNNLARGDVTLEVVVSGTGPFEYQWMKDGSAIPEATSATLQLSGVTEEDMGTYTLEVNNAQGALTTPAIDVVINERASPPEELAIDFNARGNETEELTQEGFESFAIRGEEAGETGEEVGIITGPTTRTFDGVRVTVSRKGPGGYDDRLREEPTNVPGEFTLGPLFRDFTWANTTVGGDGFNILIEFLEPNQFYEVKVWSFDIVSGGDRISDWFVNQEKVKEAYTFNGENPPTTDQDNQFAFTAQADSKGKLLIQGLQNDASSQFGVFLNGLRVTETVAPLKITSFAIEENEAILEVKTQFPDREHRVQMASNLGNPEWSEVETSFTPNGDESLETGFALPSGSPNLFRVVNVPPPPLFEADFESGQGEWETGGPVPDLWELGTPNFGINEAHSGENAFGTRLDGPYEVEEVGWLRSPEIDLTEVSAATLTFFEAVDSEEGFDFRRINIKDADDPDGEPIAQLVEDSGANLTWANRSLSLPENVIGERVIIEFEFISDDFQPTGQEQAGWYIDDVQVVPE